MLINYQELQLENTVTVPETAGKYFQDNGVPVLSIIEDGYVFLNNYVFRAKYNKAPIWVKAFCYFGGKDK